MSCGPPGADEPGVALRSVATNVVPLGMVTLAAGGIAAAITTWCVLGLTRPDAAGDALHPPATTATLSAAATMRIL